MIDIWTDFPLGARYVILAIMGLMLGSFANWGIYTFAYFPRPISPWSKPHPDAAPRMLLDRAPVIGWLGLRRERSLHGNGFWVRPMVIEIAMAGLACSLYWFEAIEWSVLGVHDRDMLQQAIKLAPQLNLQAMFDHWMNYLFFCHLLLLVLMTMATFIDFDERTVPDFITVPGTLMGLALAAVSFEIFLPYPFNSVAGRSLEPVLMLAPAPWNPTLLSMAGLWLGLGLFAGWCFAIADRRLILRKGWAKAVRVSAFDSTGHSAVSAPHGPSVGWYVPSVSTATKSASATVG